MNRYSYTRFFVRWCIPVAVVTTLLICHKLVGGPKESWRAQIRLSSNLSLFMRSLCVASPGRT